MYNLLFDFDGTLFDTDLAHELAFKKVKILTKIKNVIVNLLGLYV